MLTGLVEAEQVIHNFKSYLDELNEKISEQNNLLEMSANLLNLSNEAIFAWDFDNGIIFWNIGAEKMYGYWRDQVIGRISHEVLSTKHPYDLNLFLDSLIQSGSWKGELEHTCSDGSRLIVESNQQVISLEGRVIVLETNRDITGSKKVMTELKRSESLLRSVLDNSRDMIYRYNVSASTYDYVSPSCKAVLGYTSQEFMDFDLDESKSLIHPDDSDRVNQALIELESRNEVCITYRLRAKNGQYKWVINCMSLLREEDGTVFRDGNVCDITQQKVLEDKIMMEKRRLSAVINAMSDSVMICKKDGSVELLNETARNNFCHLSRDRSNGEVQSAHSIINYDIDGVVVPFEDLPRWRVFQSGVYHDYRFTLRNTAGKFYYSANGSPIYDENGQFDSAVICTRDITEQVTNNLLLRERQELIVKAQQEKNEVLSRELEMKDNFISLISHEFKTPIMVIDAAVQSMDRFCDELSDKAKDYLSKIKHNNDRQLKLVNNLLDVTRIQAGRIQVKNKNVDIVEQTQMIIHSIHSYAEQRSVSIEFYCTVDKKIVGLDEEKYERVLLNLLSNAVKFSLPNKSIIVNLAIKKVNGENKVVVQVIDEGVGIPADKMDVIFEKFGQVDCSQSRNAEGTGIGLYIVKMLVDLMQGEIKVKSKMGEGTTFTLIIPAARIVEQQFEFEIKDLNQNRLQYAACLEFSDINAL